MNILHLMYKINPEDSPQLWDNKNISFGVARHRIIEDILLSKNIRINHKDLNEAFIRDNKIILPFKTHFANDVNYYHTVLHEYAHYKSNELNQSIHLNIHIKEYSANFGQYPNINGLLEQFASTEHLRDADKTIYNLITSYVHEEVKCEVAAFQTMEHAQMNISKINEQNVVSTINFAKGILSLDGRHLLIEFQDKNSQISKELKSLSDAMCKDYDMAKERVMAKNKERERER